MKKYLKKSLMVLFLMVLSFNTLACNKDNNVGVSNTGNTQNTETIDLEETKNETNPDNELAYNTSKTLSENIDILNNTLETKYGKSLRISTAEDYEMAEQSDWTLVLEDNRVGIDTSTWKFDYDSNSDDSKYMDAILSTFTFFCGEDMGNSLWLLTGDLLDDGADETLYGFVHDGSQAVYKNGNVAAYEPGNSKSTMYIWLTPSEY
jgi:hypothetical protein